MTSASEVTRPEDVEQPEPHIADRLAAYAADKAARVWFLTANLVWWVTWLSSHGYGLDNSGFTIFTLLLSLEAIILTIAVLIQNRLDAAARDAQAEADIKNNAIAAEKAEKISDQLDRLELLIKGTGEHDD
jgi:uncharacterized membrane protein